MLKTFFIFFASDIVFFQVNTNELKNKKQFKFSINSLKSKYYIHTVIISVEKQRLFRYCALVQTNLTVRSRYLCFDFNLVKFQFKCDPFFISWLASSIKPAGRLFILYGFQGSEEKHVESTFLGFVQGN